ncbi:hypothetical protein [Novosphingobium sp. TCA1]|uniref:hypothetical protein n=1 Tax=Novosphingobium sp. TCA1 TaxID=2682474 RepID=UPI00130AE8BC|nr:hypothetical protein [Novosphingobium sp. TCA1]GFE73378.1 hypothetical protein NTCA1_10270 [Novosphingobium sp. TCA1]
MILTRLLATAALVPGAALVSAPTALQSPAQGASPATPQAAAAVKPVTLPPAPRLPRFAADLAQQPAIVGPAAWAKLSEAEAWTRLARVPRPERQQARWNYARSLIGQERGGEAFGVLEVMRQDDPDLEMVDTFRLAQGAALTLLGRYPDALAALGAAGLGTNPEACAWRLRALAQSALGEQALQQLDCARPALAIPRPRAFVLAAARGAIEGGAPAKAMQWLSPLPDRDPAANLYRGRAELALGHADQARLRFARVERSGTMEQRMDARLSEVESEVAHRAVGPEAALKRLDAIRYAWRGDAIEERALRLTYKLYDARGDLSGALAAGAALFRYHDVGRQGADFLPGLRTKLTDALDPARKLPLDKAAGLYWDYRDIAPGGAEGDLMASHLAERLQQAGLYERAGDLLTYQLFVRAGDLARGPLSARVATLFILAGRPDRALQTLRKSDDPSFPDPMIAARKRVEAAALSQIGRIDEAMAVLQDVPDADTLRAEILWKQRDWARYAEASAAGLPTGRGLDAIGQAVVLRHAISLAMLGREEALSGLHARYAAAFQGLPSAPVFEMLTGSPAQASGPQLARAMAAMPSVSPAGEFADLLERAPGSTAPRG